MEFGTKRLSGSGAVTLRAMREGRRRGQEALASPEDLWLELTRRNVSLFSYMLWGAKHRPTFCRARILEKLRKL